MVKIINTSGKNKTAIARAKITEGVGRIRVNKKPIEIYEPEIARLKILEAVAFMSDNVTSKIDIDVNVRGGGIMGQANAVRTAIGKGIVEWTGDLAVKDAMLAYDRSLLVNDSRQKETKKFGGPGARAKSQKSYR
ncbi:MAG: 30S ribosomal protein S9 [ANME-2 cluster archaeon]|nr:30S ribosomal protein S9 [ANME-2 cluster archaeon]MBC2700934.1 30S ribosomal protein S9 [ANME-2 cluster archaeon]MBC2709070.1 30S ribosomal protein S9 [ANME-2 cluster archaeon]MBC2747411.1 30S ribosomal protein S9 [ANME-2 cluster archaeon]MBC2762261.1 30S ribosomal protein S9 [ANME-2 cluster archaeon]